MLRDRQLERICAALCARARRPQAWGSDGRPADAGLAILRGEDDRLSSSQRVLVEVAFATWNQMNREARVADAIRLLDNVNLRMVGQLLCLLGEERDQAGAAERWLETWGPPSEPEPHGARRSS